MTFTVHEYEDDFALISHADHKIALDLPEMLDEIRALPMRRPAHHRGVPDRAVGRRAARLHRQRHLPRPVWRKRDADGALRVSIEDAEALGLVDGGRARITTAAGSAEATVEISEAMLPGHASLPNGFGLDFIDGDGQPYRSRASPRMRSRSTEWRDAYAGTPWHKHVPARIEPVPVALATT